LRKNNSKDDHGYRDESGNHCGSNHDVVANVVVAVEIPPMAKTMEMVVVVSITMTLTT
jgi:hypothetical protein